MLFTRWAFFWHWARPIINHKTFFSLGELNAYLCKLIDAFNIRVQRKYGVSRRVKIGEAERSKLLALPTTTYLAIGVSLNLNEKDIASLLVFAATEDLISTIDKMKASAE